MMERAAAVLGNLSTDAHFFAGLREAGAVQVIYSLQDRQEYIHVIRVHKALLCTEVLSDIETETCQKRF